MRTHALCGVYSFIHMLKMHTLNLWIIIANGVFPSFSRVILFVALFDDRYFLL